MEVASWDAASRPRGPQLTRRSLARGSPRSKKHRMKERLRQKCLARAREQRDALLRERRRKLTRETGGENIAEAREGVQGDAMCILESECKEDHGLAEWERQGLVLTEEDREELMRSIEEVLQSELDMDEDEAIEQYRMIAQVETAELQDLQETLGLGDDAVICPVCRKDYLVRTPSAQMIVCACGLRIDGGIDGLGLEQLRASLAALHSEHALCGGSITFELDDRFGESFLRARCPCGLDQIVM